MASPAAPAATAAQARWELENGVLAGGPPGGDASASAPDGVAALYTWDPATAAAVQRDKPWARDPHYFKR